VGFLDSLFGKKKARRVEVVDDRIWMSTDAKFRGLAKEVVERSNSGSVAILLVAHFPDVLARLNEIADRQNLDVPVKAVPANDLTTTLAATLNLDESATLDIIVGERHPLPSVDDRLEAFAAELPCRCRFSHHVSLDDAVLEAFAGEWVRNILEKLGMSEDEAIESAMVSRRIRHAQQKIEGEAFGTVTAESAADWLSNNCPQIKGS
jgi:preprotein translocase subunit SecA